MVVLASAATMAVSASHDEEGGLAECSAELHGIVYFKEDGVYLTQTCSPGLGHSCEDPDYTMRGTEYWVLPGDNADKHMCAGAGPLPQSDDGAADSYADSAQSWADTTSGWTHSDSGEDIFSTDGSFADSSFDGTVFTAPEADTTTDGLDSTTTWTSTPPSDETDGSQADASLDFSFSGPSDSAGDGLTSTGGDTEVGDANVDGTVDFGGNTDTYATSDGSTVAGGDYVGDVDTNIDGNADYSFGGTSDNYDTASDGPTFSGGDALVDTNLDGAVDYSFGGTSDNFGATDGPTFSGGDATPLDDGLDGTSDTFDSGDIITDASDVAGGDDVEIDGSLDYSFAGANPSDNYGANDGRATTTPEGDMIDTNLDGTLDSTFIGVSDDYAVTDLVDGNADDIGTGTDAGVDGF